MLRHYPFISLPHALGLARVAVAVFFMAHAIARITLGTIPEFGTFMESAGFAQGVAVVWAITLVELVAGSFLILNRQVRYAATALFFIAAGGVVMIHRHLGWFVGEHGTGGSEYSVALMVLLIVVAAADRRGSTRL